MTAATHHRSRVVARPLPPLFDRFGIRSIGQVARDLGEVVRGSLDRSRFQFDLRSTGLLRPDLSLPAYAGLVPADGLAPIFNLFDREGGGFRFTQRVSRATVRDFRGGRLSYDEHDGIDFVCPIGTPLCAAAPGTVVMIRDRFLRGGLTVAVDHGHGVVTQYTHCSRALQPIGSVLRRGEPVALSGAAGFDMVQFFPWIPPHIHFMSVVDGRPVDPFLATGEAAHAGCWADGDARPSGPLPGDGAVEPSPVDTARLDEVVAACTDARILAEIAARRHAPEQLAALVEDALIHDMWAFPAELHRASVRPAKDPRGDAHARSIALSLPLPAEQYRGARFADTWYTRPR